MTESSAGHAPAERFFIRKRADRNVAKVSPGEFIRQVRAETAKVVWPTRKETVQTAIMVLIMTLALAIFFSGTDGAFYRIVRLLLGFAAKQ